MNKEKGRLTKAQKALKGLKELYVMSGYTSNYKEKSCNNCKHYDTRFPPPFCLICKTGFDDNYRKRDYWEEKN